MKKKNKNYIYTNKKQSAKGVFSTVMAVMVSLTLFFMVNYSYRHGGEVMNSFGAGALVCTFFTILGLLLSIFARYESDKFMHFVHLGILLNVLNLLALSGILYAGT